MEANGLRGEVTAKVGKIELVMVASMDGLAKLSASLNYPSLQDLHRRLIGTEINTMRAVIRLFTVRGTEGGQPIKGPDNKELTVAAIVDRAVRELRLDDLSSMQDASIDLLAALMRPATEADEKNGAGGTTA